MKAVKFEFFSSRSSHLGSENKGAILENIVPLFLRASSTLFTKFLHFSPRQSPAVCRSQMGLYYVNTTPFAICKPRELSRRPKEQKFNKQSTRPGELILINRIFVSSTFPWMQQDFIALNPEKLQNTVIKSGKITVWRA